MSLLPDKVKQTLHRALIEDVVPALAEGVVATSSKEVASVERLVRRVAIMLLFRKCAAARDLLLPAQISDLDNGIDQDCIARAGALLHNLSIDWSTLPARVVGECYEALLAHQLTDMGGHIVLVPERGGRKATGTFYTPEPIVKRIVAATIGPIVNEHEHSLHAGLLRWEEAIDICLLDPAMGSGHFLLEAVDYVSDWLLNLNRFAPAGTTPDNKATARQTVLNRCIYGVDRDPDAVDVARLCLWLHCATPGWSFDASERNLRCGHSLVGATFNAPSSVSLPDEIQPFDWAAAFGAVGERGGFDAIIGNPPYVTRFSPAEQRAIMGWTRTRGRELDAFYLFVERSVYLLRAGGRCGMIIPNVFMRQHDSAPFRRFLLNYTLEEIADYGFGTFGAATVPTAILLLRTEPPKADHVVEIESADGTRQSILQATFAALPDAQFNAQLATIQPLLIDIERRCAPLATFATSHEGVHSGNIRYKLFTKEANEDTARPMLKGSDIGRYSLHWGGWYVRYDTALIDRTSGEYASLRDERLFREPKIWTRQTADRIIATWDEQGFYADNTLHSTQPRADCPLSPFYLLALLNSTLLTAIYQALTGEQGRALAQVKLVFLRRLPIRRIHFTTPPEVRKQLLREGIKTIEEYLSLVQSVEQGDDTILTLVDGWLNDKEDVVHDLLGWLAQQMIILTQKGDAHAPLLDQIIDRIVERLYGVEAKAISVTNSTLHEKR